MSGAHGDHGGPPHDLVQGGPGVGQLRHVLHARQPVRLHHARDLGLDPAPHRGVVNHEEDGPLQRRLERLHARCEDVQDDLLQLTLGVLVKHLLQGARLPGPVHLDQVGVHQVPGVVGVERVAVILDDVADKLQHLIAVLLQIVEGRRGSGQVLENWDENHRPGQVEKAEALIKQMHEPLKLLVVVMEPC